MSKYKAGDKVVVEIEKAALTDNGGGLYIVLDYMQSAISVDEKSEPLSTYTEPLETKIENLKKKLKRWVEKCTNQSTEITRLLAENEKLKAENGNVIWEIEQAFDRGCNAAWELARKIVLKNGYSAYDLHEIFNCCGSHQALEDFTYHEAAEKVAEWEKAKEEIKVGDVYKNDIGNYFVVCDTKNSEFIKILWKCLKLVEVSAEYIKEDCVKTGRHIDIDSFLKQIGGESDEK